MSIKVREFHENLHAISLLNPVMMIRGKEIYFVEEQVKELYVLPNADMVERISMHDFTIEARIWFNIIYSSVSPYTYITSITDLRDLMVDLFIYVISQNVGEIVLKEWGHFNI